ncbi:6ad758b7-d700-4aac-a5b6-01b7329d0cf6 [Sclerotinia trifoliorum]|uniref:6ad758b7-d700-4aac-a5b6-01b7329d0cf6 n=1 Tax=Sclerotinia trifoliorum TaxID=28548 RepID=A0A8H2VLS7_9HELO|nr:6ad758b7-d700-4aac-a5b6-01b7329d0cf6 [Sclerotinia trifoliorum]
MPPKKVVSKPDNNTLVRTAVANQINLAEEFKQIWNKLDHDRFIEDMGVGNRNAAFKRFKRWAAGIVKSSVKSHEDDTDATDTEHKTEPTGKAVKKVSGPPTKREIRREESVPESTKKVAGKKKAIGKRKKIDDEGFTDECTGKATVSADMGNDSF